MTKKSTKKAIAKAKPVPVPAVPMTPPALLAIAVEQGADIDKLDKLMNLQIRWEEREAQKAFTVAMADFKSDPPEIFKNKTVKYGQTEYDHASLDNVATTLGEALSKQGLSFGWKTDQGEAGAITVTCTITHILGHSESTSLSAGPDQSGGKNNIQAVGSTVSYLQRYTLLAITGTATQDMDDDGGASGPRHEEPDYDCINDDQISQLNDLVIAAHVNPQKILYGFEITDIIQLPAERFQECVERLNAAKAAYDKKQDGEAKDGDTPAAVYKCTECGEALVEIEGTACNECLSHID
ncbi:MAG TPA: hypothetical protein ENG78_07705 [Acidiferrobacteraceae bacterium]|nr:hypothetical protein [Acidiferrobacteraceae bacterium]HEX20686.1 hypothetical protein [Acidiferrobacteraceae bacterium]